MSTNIYVLRLEGGRYYIGKTDNVIYRYQQHMNGYGSAWTRKYRPMLIEKVINNASPFEEDKVTKEYMSKYGIDKVRGGSYVQMELSEDQQNALKMEIRGATDKCTKCGHHGHFVKDCYAKTGVKLNKFDDSSDEWGCDYCDRTFTTEFGCSVHEKSCKKKNTKISYMKQPTSKKGGVCYRCGRDGHYFPECYARTHQTGYTLDSDGISDDDSDDDDDDSD